MERRRLSGNGDKNAMTPNEFRQLALRIPGASESSHNGHPDFRIRGRVFATLGYPDEAWGMVKLDLVEQARFAKDHPGTFRPAKGAWGAQGSTLVELASVKAKVLREAIEKAADSNW